MAWQYSLLRPAPPPCHTITATTQIVPHNNSYHSLQISRWYCCFESSVLGFSHGQTFAIWVAWTTYLYDWQILTWFQRLRGSKSLFFGRPDNCGYAMPSQAVNLILLCSCDRYSPSDSERRPVWQRFAQMSSWCHNYAVNRYNPVDSTMATVWLGQLSTCSTHFCRSTTILFFEQHYNPFFRL